MKGEKRGDKLRQYKNIAWFGQGVRCAVSRWGIYGISRFTAQIAAGILALGHALVEDFVMRGVFLFFAFASAKRCCAAIVVVFLLLIE